MDIKLPTPIYVLKQRANPTVSPRFTLISLFSPRFSTPSIKTKDQLSPD
jgi:hypothetical protein